MLVFLDLDNNRSRFLIRWEDPLVLLRLNLKDYDAIYVHKIRSIKKNEDSVGLERATFGAIAQCLATQTAPQSNPAETSIRANWHHSLLFWIKELWHFNQKIWESTSIVGTRIGNFGTMAFHWSFFWQSNCLRNDQRLEPKSELKWTTFNLNNF